MNNNNTIEIKNFKLDLFKSLLKQSLFTNEQLIFNFTNDFLRNVTFTPTASLMKLIIIPSKKLIASKAEQNENELNLDDSEIEEIELENFNFDFYILKGEFFNKFISVFSSELVDINFTIADNIATALTIKGKTNEGSVLSSTFCLTSADFITNKIDDYNDIINFCKPTVEAAELNLTNKQIAEIKRLIKNLHKVDAKNQPFITFDYKHSTNTLNVSDKVFNVEYQLDIPIDRDIKFNIVKSDFVIIGNHDMKIYYSENETKIIFITLYKSSVISCLSQNINENNITDYDLTNTDNAIGDLSEYID